MTDRPDIPEAAVEALAKRRWEMAQSAGPFAALGKSWEELRRDPHRREDCARPLVAAYRDLQAAAPALRKQGAEEVQQRLAHGGEPDLSPGDVIAAEPDGTITLDDGITTWNPARACEFLTRQALAKGAEEERERLRRGLEALDRFVVGTGGGPYEETPVGRMTLKNEKNAPGERGPWWARIDVLAALTPAPSETEEG